MDFEYITLTRREYARLKKLAKSPSGLPTAPHETNLVNNRLISRARYGSPQSNGETPYTVISSITQEGKNYIAYTKKARIKKRIESRRFFWTTLIALLALLIAIAALVIDLWQLGLLQWPQG